MSPFTFLRQDRHGVALPLALFALVIAAVMITAVFYVARVEKRMGDNTVAGTQAFEAAETGIASTIANWDPTSYNGVAINDTMSLGTTTIAGGRASYSTTLRRLNSMQFLIVVEGRALQGGQVITRRKVARIVRLASIAAEGLSAIDSRVGMTLDGLTFITGNDSVPPAWVGGTCPSPGPSRYGIRDSTGISAIIAGAGCTSYNCVHGLPPAVVTDNGINNDDFNRLGAMTYAEVASIADKVVTGTVSPGPTFLSGPPAQCKKSDLTNWGDPTSAASPCFNFFPIIYAPGNLTLGDGVGQGFLLVDGDLTISGNMQFYGAVFVHGGLTMNNGTIFGELLVQNVPLHPTTINGTFGTANVIYSRCALNRSAQGGAGVKPIEERSWAQLY